MKHILPFSIYESQTPSGLNKRPRAFLNSYTKGIWSVNPTTGLVDIQGDFNLIDTRAESFLGVCFGHITGDFECSLNQLQSLKGAPREVGGDFKCSGNQLKSLEGAPRKVVGNFECLLNQLQSLEGAPREVGGNFKCSGNQLQSLEGAPKEINGRFECNKFSMEKGEWNIRRWLEVLETGSGKAKELILTLPYLQPDWWNSELQRDPGKTVHLLAKWWKDMPEDMKSQIKIPPGYQDEFGLFSGFGQLGLF